MALTLKQLIDSLEGITGSGDLQIPITRITADSRQADAETLFIAVRGTSGDGHQYLDQVADSGCRAVVVEEYSGTRFEAVITAQETRRLPALLARKLHDNPDEYLMTAGVTGTNGKTTVSFLLRQMLGHLNGPCGLLGTICYDDGHQSIPAPLTTPGGPVFYQWLHQMRQANCQSVAMEISSHALDQGRTEGLGLDVAIMTNLGRDHLDYHRDMQEYLAAKARILDLLRDQGQGPRKMGGTLVLNVGDKNLAGLDHRGLNVLKFSAEANPCIPADLQVTQADLSLDGTKLEFTWKSEKLELISPLVGRYNVENLTAALGAGLALGFSADQCVRALAEVQQVPGRLERIALPQGAIAVVDYAHTHDALAAVLEACDELKEKQLMVVFGCGGDRDKGKRPLMGEVAARHADSAWITSDNPRSEGPDQICQDILVGYEQVRTPRSQAVQVVVDRRAAIESALTEAKAGDIVVIAGKGHEDYQLVGDQRLDLDDRQLVRDWVKGQGHHA